MRLGPHKQGTKLLLSFASVAPGRNVGNDRKPANVFSPEFPGASVFPFSNMALAIYHTGQAAIAQPRTPFPLPPSDQQTAGKTAAAN
jgi:hypothetical protein